MSGVPDGRLERLQALLEALQDRQEVLVYWPGKWAPEGRARCGGKASAFALPRREVAPVCTRGHRKNGPRVPGSGTGCWNCRACRGFVERVGE